MLELRSKTRGHHEGMRDLAKLLKPYTINCQQILKIVLECSHQDHAVMLQGPAKHDEPIWMLVF